MPHSSFNAASAPLAIGQSSHRSLAVSPVRVALPLPIQPAQFSARQVMPIRRRIKRQGRNTPRLLLSIAPIEGQSLSTVPTPADARFALLAKADRPHRCPKLAIPALTTAAAHRKCARLPRRPVHLDRLRFVPGERAIERRCAPLAGRSVQQGSVETGNQRLHDLPLQNRINAARIGRCRAKKHRRQLVVQFDIGLQIRADADFALT